MRTKRSSWDGEWAYAKAWVLGTLAVAGAGATVGAFVPSLLAPPSSLFLILGAMVVGMAWARYHTRPRHLPSEGLEPDVTAGRPFRLVCPCSADEVAAANRLAAVSYDCEPIDPERVQQWLLKNPKTITVLLDPNGEVVAYFDIFPLTAKFGDAFRAGYATEYELGHAEMVGPDAPPEGMLYLGGVAVRDWGSWRGCLYGRMAIRGIVEFLLHFYRLDRPIELLASAASPEGRKLLKRFGFRIVSHAERRRDAADLFSMALTRPVLEELLSEYPSYRWTCESSWTRPEQLATKPRAS